MANYGLGKIKNDKPKIKKMFSFAYEDGYEALDWLDERGKETKGGMSAYIIRLILEDKRNTTGHAKWLNRLEVRKSY